MPEWKSITGRTLTPCETAVEAVQDYTNIFRRIQVEWLAYFGIVKCDDDDSSEPPPLDAPPEE